MVLYDVCSNFDIMMRMVDNLKSLAEMSHFLFQGLLDGKRSKVLALSPAGTYPGGQRIFLALHHLLHRVPHSRRVNWSTKWHHLCRCTMNREAESD